MWKAVRRYNLSLLLFTPLVTIAILVLKFVYHTNQHFSSDISAVVGYLNVIGVLYSILAAFIIYVVWGQFNETQRMVEKEVNDLEDLIDLAEYLNDPVAEKNLKDAIAKYADSVINDEWPAMQKGTKSRGTKKYFNQLYTVVGEIKFDDKKDSIIWPSITSKLNDISDSRAARLTLCDQKLPNSLKYLLYIVSFGLLVGFFVLSLNNDLIIVLVTTITTLIVFFVIELILDLDGPFEGQWVVCPDSFEALLENTSSRTTS